MVDGVLRQVTPVNHLGVLQSNGLRSFTRSSLPDAYIRALVRPTSVSGTEKDGPVRYRYSVDGAVESVDKKQDVRNELNKRPAH
jgi:hypothetical protein